jgi:hypothetical protein
MNDQPTERDRPACSNPDCTSGEAPTPGYDDCDPCSWESYLGRVNKEWQTKVDALQVRIDDRQTILDTIAILEGLDAVIADESRTHAERNAARADRAVRLLNVSTGKDINPLDAARPRDTLVRALADFLHCGNLIGMLPDQFIARAVRQYGSEAEAEDAQTWDLRGTIEVACPHCGEQVQQVKRWHEPCSACRTRLGLRDDRISDDPVEANLQRAHLVEDTLDGFAARTGQAGLLADADLETCAEVLRDFLCNAGHWADETGLDLDQLVREGREVYREEHAEAAEETAAAGDAPCGD